MADIDREVVALLAERRAALTELQTDPRLKRREVIAIGDHLAELNAVHDGLAALGLVPERERGLLDLTDPVAHFARKA